MASLAPNFTGQSPTMPQYALPQELGYQLSISTYLAVGSLSVFLWDILHSLNEERKLLFQHRLGPSTVAYFISRISALLILIFGVIFFTVPLPGRCITWQKVHCCSFIFVLGSSAYLFLVRIALVYHGNNLVIGFFSLAWLAVIGGAITLPVGISAQPIKGTDYCTFAQVEGYTVSASLNPMIFDILVFVAISWKLTLNAYNENGQSDAKTFFLGRSLPAFSKALLHDGQKYYLATVVSNVICVTLLFMGTNIPVQYKTMGEYPNVLIISALACKVYRNTRLGIYREATTKMDSFGADAVNTTGVLPVFRRPPYHVRSEIATGGKVASNPGSVDLKSPVTDSGESTFV